ncbi:MAG: lysylphosphatidylglycerol synthase transmembrane domain-containing protein [Candidatus Aureabacteria bacterium]|nr:lysylphosphatidylglycerol synthase transmembrane domain-containing protein [Candidatus Auribacterota bacterium]
MNKVTRAAIGVALAAVCLVLAFRNTNIPELVRNFKEARYVWMIPTIGFILLTMVCRVFRWQCLLRPIGRIGFLDLFSALNICFMANNILPARSGEFIRAVLVGKKQKINISAVLATVVLERISDAVCVMGIFLFLIFSFSVEAELKHLGLALVALYVGLLALLVAARLRPEGVKRAIHRCIAVFSERAALRVEGVTGSFLQGLNVLHDLGQVALTLCYSILVWGGILLTYYCVNRAFDIRGMGFSGYALLLSMLSVAVMLPTPGYLGSYQLAYKKALVVFRHAGSLALACGWVAWGIQYIVINLLGVVSLWREGVSFGRLQKEEAQVEAGLRQGGGREP